MSYFLHNEKIDLQTPFLLSGSEASHLTQSRRIRPGEMIQVQDSTNRRYNVLVIRVDKTGVTLNALKEIQPPKPSNLKLTLFQSLVKEKATDFIIQKTTELGITNIVFFHCHYSQRLKNKEMIEKRLDRWRKIALEACKQSERVDPPALFFLSDLAKFHQFCAESSIATSVNLCLESSPESVPVNRIDIPESKINVFVGPEGGWSKDDLQDIPVNLVQLGPRILRSDTAAISITAILQALHGDISGHLPHIPSQLPNL